MSMRNLVKLFVSGVASVAMTAPISAAETITYTYDARGRLVKVERAGSVNNNVKTEYERDKANNRKKVKTTGA